MTTPSASMRASSATATRHRRVLYIAYMFPPIGGAGVQRTTKFVKYLGAHGWDVSVLTVDGGSVPVWDPELLAEVPSSIDVRRAKTLEPSYKLKERRADPAATQSIIGRLRTVLQNVGRVLLQPDSQILWLPASWRAAKAMLAEGTYDAIITTGPPFSPFLLGAAVARRTGLPLILDYRDEWSLSNQFYENRRPGAVTGAVQRYLEAWCVRRATVLLATTRQSARALASVAAAAGAAAKATWIYNGYDPADFANIVPESRPQGRFRMVYTGTLWGLMSMRPMVEALERLSAEHPDLVPRLELVIAGRRTPDEQVHVDRLRSFACVVDERSYLGHQDALSLMASADALCLLLADLPGADRWVPGKTFEYLAMGLPIVAVIPDGELRSLLVEARAHVIHPSRIDQLVTLLVEQLAAIPAPVRASARCQSVHSRPNQARQMATLLDSLVSAGTSDVGSGSVTYVGPLTEPEEAA